MNSHCCLSACFYIHQCLSIYLCITPLILVGMFMRSPCCLCSSPPLMLVINTDHLVVCIYISVYPLIFLVFYAVHFISKESRQLVLPRVYYCVCLLPLSLIVFPSILLFILMAAYASPFSATTYNKRLA
jgi:hypothetical protein